MFFFWGGGHFEAYIYNFSSSSIVLLVTLPLIAICIKLLSMLPFEGMALFDNSLKKIGQKYFEEVKSDSWQAIISHKHLG